jgi:hypothetical protein
VPVYFESSSDFGSESFKSDTFGFQKKGDSSICHYTVEQASGNDPWKLKKAWRTDQNDKIIEEFPVP